MVTAEKERHIRKLLKLGRTWNQITLEARCSPNTIKKVEEKSRIPSRRAIGPKH